MACATLKRSLDLDPLHSPTSRPTKRRRYGAMSSPSSSAAIAPARDEVASPFAAVTPSLTSEQITTHIREEMKRLNRRRQLYNSEDKEPSGMSGAGSGPPSPGSTGGAANDFHVEPLGSPTSSSYQSNKDKDKPLFTFRQVGLICERMMKEREDCLRELYDQVLSTKLAEQYDMFVKFTYDQIQRRYEAAAPSYLS